MPAMKNDEIIIPALLEKGVTPEDAYNCFMSTEIDYLVCGNWLLDRRDQPVLAEAAVRRTYPPD